MKAWRLATTVLALMLCTHCGPDNGPVAPDPEPVIRPAAGSELCPQACDAMKNKLLNADGGVGCEEALPAPVEPGAGDTACFDGGPPNDCLSCVGFCEQMHASGSFWNTECIVTAVTHCMQIETVCNTQ